MLEWKSRNGNLAENFENMYFDLEICTFDELR